MSEVIPFPDAYEFVNITRAHLELQNHAWVRVWRAECPDLTRGLPRHRAFIESLLAQPIYQESNLGYMTQPMAGVHGPFEIARMAPEDFVEIARGEWILEIAALLQSSKWQLAPLSVENTHRAMEFIEQLFFRQTRILRLQLCDAFNEYSYRPGENEAKLAASSYHHAWSHALVAFHEFLSLDTSSGHCCCLMLAYE